MQRLTGILVLAALSASILMMHAHGVQAAPPLQLPWPSGEQHRINSGGNTYDCDTHTTATAGSSTAYNANKYAIDFQFSSTAGLNIGATAAGKVVYRDNNNDGYGNKVVLDHADGHYSVYAHLRHGDTWGPGIVPGARVRHGQLLGYADCGTMIAQEHPFNRMSREIVPCKGVCVSNREPERERERERRSEEFPSSSDWQRC